MACFVRLFIELAETLSKQKRQFVALIAPRHLPQEPLFSSAWAPFKLSAGTSGARSSGSCSGSTALAAQQAAVQEIGADTGNAVRKLLHRVGIIVHPGPNDKILIMIYDCSGRAQVLGV